MQGEGLRHGGRWQWKWQTLECSLVTGVPGVLCPCRILQLWWEWVLQPDHGRVPRLPQVRAGWRTLHGNFSFFYCWGEHIKHQRQKTQMLCYVEVVGRKGNGEGYGYLSRALTSPSVPWEGGILHVHQQSISQEQPGKGILSKLKGRSSIHSLCQSVLISVVI